jgi:hypothetical protein
MKKRKRRLGHITSVENVKVGQALWMAKHACERKTGDAREGCLLGLAVVKEELGYEGFKLSGRNRR